MATILCPTRGGERSFPNQDRAIALARERGADLIFLYVSDVRFLDRLASPILVDVEEELEEMGEFLLAMAQERAERQGVRATTVVRQGVFREALKAVIEESGVSTVVLGSSPEDAGITSLEYIDELAHWIVSETGVDVMIVREGEIIAHYYAPRPSR